jgi:hypothetical protein
VADDFDNADLMDHLPDAFTPFSSAEVDELRMFAQHIADIEELDLAGRKTITMNLGPKGGTVEDVDRDRVGALISGYRKIALLNDEPGTFNKARNLLGRHAREKETPRAEAILGWLRQLKKMHKAIVGEGRVMAYQLEMPDGSSEVLKPETIVDWLVNGVVSHSDTEARRRWEALGGWKNGGVVMNVLVTVSDDLQVFRGLNELVLGILAARDLAPEAVDGTDVP